MSIQPTQEVSQDFILSNNPITLEATLDKELYYHGETMNVNVQVCNLNLQEIINHIINDFNYGLLFIDLHKNIPTGIQTFFVEENINLVFDSFVSIFAYFVIRKLAKQA